MDNLLLLPFISGFCVLIGLVYGSYYDIKYRISPKWIWKFIAPISLIFTILWYIGEFQQTRFTVIIPVIITSCVFILLSIIMAFKQGNGGDWRALFYISLLTPWVIISVFITSCVFGVLQIGIAKLRKIETPVPWMVGITLGFVISYGLYFIR